MIRFLFKGLLRDKSRSLLPIIVVSIGVALTVFLSGWIRGAMSDVIDMTSKFDTGHAKVTTRAYRENISQVPNDLAILGADQLTRDLHKKFPDTQWVQRIKFGGLLDVPDDQGETRSQGPASGMAIELLSPTSQEVERLNIASSIVAGKMPEKPGEALIGVDFAQKLQLEPGGSVTFFGSTMNSSMTFMNFTVSGFVCFGSAVMDRGAMIIDISDARNMLDMEDACGEILGYFENGVYSDSRAMAMAGAFNDAYSNDPDQFAPVMARLKDQGNLASYLDYVDSFSLIFVGIFVVAMSVVLWNTGLIGGLRRYQEFGIRLALGESKNLIFQSLIAEALLIGIMGSIVGTTIGVIGAWILQVHGVDIGSMTANSTMMMPSVIRSKVTPDLFYIGFIPGVFAMVLGNLLAGMGVFKRETAQLFKELEV